MRANIVRIGNSRGVRIPKALLEQVGIQDSVELTVEAGRLVIEPARRHPREGWAEEARQARAVDEDLLIDGETFDDFDQAAWEW